jgi:homoserine O-acetyltransferase
MRILAAAFSALALTMAGSAMAATPYAEQVTQGDYVVPNFTFKSGESLPNLKLHYRTLGQPKRDAQGHVTNAMMVLHGTGGTGAQFLSPQFADELYGPWPAARHPLLHHPARQCIGHGASSKPSNGLREIPALRL